MYIRWFDDIGMKDLAQVGGKNASLGEMYNYLSSSGVEVPNGFAITTAAFDKFMADNQLISILDKVTCQLDKDHLQELSQVSQTMRDAILQGTLPLEVRQAIRQAYQTLVPQSEAVAVRSSATAEDLPQASFAGQQETYLNVCGIEEVLNSVKHVYASLFSERAIAYRIHHGFLQDVKISVGIQKMVRSDLASSGVMFTIDTESGYEGVILLSAAYGLGEPIVQGMISPDEFYLSKSALSAHHPAILRRRLGRKDIKMIYSPQGVQTVAVDKLQQVQFSLTDEDIEALGKLALQIEHHYQKPMDIEWAKDGQNGRLYIVQARPETVISQHSKLDRLVQYHIDKRGEVLCKGCSIGNRIGMGQARVISDIAKMHTLQAGEILITDMTDPDWEPVMKRAAGIVTNRGGRTCHAAIIARELGIPAIVGCHDATERLAKQSLVSVSCAEGDTGYVYAGALNYRISEQTIDHLPTFPFKVMLNLANPDRALAYHRLPNDGVGLARLEFIISNIIGIHPQAVLNLKKLPESVRLEILTRSQGYSDPVSFYVEKLAESIATIATVFYPNPVIVRLSDFKSNEYANLLGGDLFEPAEENPMLGFRGAARYISKQFKACFELECQAIRLVREHMQLTNVQLMIPFVRTVEEAAKVIDGLAEYGLQRGVHDLKVIMMCEIPANALLADQFLDYFDGFSIGSNDMTQLTLGIDRDSGLLADQFDERSEAVKQLLSLAIQACRRRGKYVGICGQGPSDYIDFARWLVAEGIDSISLNPDSVLDLMHRLAA